MTHEIRVLRKGNEEFDCEISIREIARLPESCPMFTVVVRDITERKRIEQRWWDSMSNFYKVVNSSADGIIVTNNEGIVRFINPAAELLFGKKNEDFQGKQFGFPITLGDTTEIDIIREDGETVVAEMRIVETIWFDEIAYLATLRDVTERKQAQQAQERLSQQLQEKVSELETFSYAIAHDLKSPLVSIQGFVNLLQSDIQDMNTERVHEDIHVIESGIRKMGQLLKASLEYSRASHQIQPNENIPFGKIVEEVLEQLAEQLRSIGATVSLTDTFPMVYVDRMRMVQALTNLIQNSINYRDKTRPLTIEVGHWPSKDEVVFFVRDNGIGIDASETGKIFDLFYRGTTDGEGSGAGLAIVKRIIEAHGGRIWAQGQSGKETTMYFALPQHRGTDNGG